METNPYEYDSYDKTLPWVPQQNQTYENWYVPARTSQPSALQNSRLQQRRVEQKPKPPERMPKARALALAHTLKKWLAVASLVGFGTFSGLAAFHQIGTTASQAGQTNNTSSGSSQATPSTSSSSQDNNGFFNQQGGNNFGSGSSSQGSTSGSSSSSSGSVTGTGVS